MAGRYSKWCFTVNDDAESFHQNLEDLYVNKATHIRYICGQLERAPDTGRVHFQGYLQLLRNQQLTWLKANIHRTAHFEPQRASSNIVARDYCNKADTALEIGPFIEYGDFVRGKGERTDLRKLVEHAKSGKSQREIIEECPNEYARYIKFVDRCIGLHPPTPHEEGVQVHLYYGHPGTGKTRRAYADNPEMYVTPISNGQVWLDGYDRQEVVLLDDFAGSLSKFSLTNTLRLLDRYPVQVPVKGSFVWWCPKRIIVTTNIHPFKWYEWKEREIQYESLIRRFHTVIFFPKDDEPEQQEDLEDFFYDPNWIWLDDQELRRPLPTPPPRVVQQVVPPHSGIPERIVFEDMY